MKRPADDPPAVRKLRASAVDAGQLLAGWLEVRLGLPPGEAARRIAAGAVYVDGHRVRDPGHPLAAGARVVVHEPAERGEAAWRVIHEEAEIVVVEKPAGLPVVPGRPGGVALEEQVAARFPGARAFHRIDEGTSGLVLFARAGGARRLARALAAGTLTREYLAVVEGSPPDTLILDAPLGPDPADRRRMKASVPGGRPARTDVWVVERGPTRALVGARLSTGLTHQIRAHLAAAGHPVAGDPLYGGLSAARLALHAARLAWPGGAAESPLPAELRALVGGPSSSAPPR